MQRPLAAQHTRRNDAPPHEECFFYLYFALYHYARPPGPLAVHSSRWRLLQRRQHRQVLLSCVLRLAISVWRRGLPFLRARAAWYVERQADRTV